MEPDKRNKISDLVLEELQKTINIDSICVELCEPPSYISVFLPKTREVLLIYKKVCPVDSYSGGSHIPTEYTGDADSTVLIGQPLEAPFTTNDSFEISRTIIDCGTVQDMKYGTLPIADARNILSTCNLIIKPTHPVWVLCDGNDDNQILLLSSERKKGWFKRCWAGVQQKQELDELEAPVITHSKISNLPRNQMQFDILSTYELKKEKILVNEMYLLYSSTILELRWKKLCFDPPLDGGTKATLVTKCRIGGERDGLLLLWKQLVLLEKYLECASNRPESHIHGVNFDLPDGSFLQEFQDDTARKSPKESLISRLRNEMNKPLRGHRLNIEPNSSLAYYIHCITQIVRPGLDLTDKLWYLLIECTSYQELSLAFQQVFTVAKQTSRNKVFIRSDNMSRLATALFGDVGIFCDPLECLIEIGIEKLKTEMLLIFSKARIVTLNSLNVPKVPNFSEVPPSKWTETAKTLLLWLSRLYCVLELLCNTQTALGAGNESLLSFANTVLKEYVGSTSKVKGVKWLIDNPVQQIRVLIPTQLVQGQLSSWKEKFLNWILTVKSKSGRRKLKSVYFRGIYSLFPQEVSDNTILEDATMTVMSPLSCAYQFAELHCLSDKLYEE